MDNFKQELMELLDKYGASIYWDCADGSDIHGIYGDEMVAVNRDGLEYFSISGSVIDADEMKAVLQN